MSIASRLDEVRARINAACVRAGRLTSDVRLVAVSKTKPIELIREALVAGQRTFGENYVQEAVEKIASMGAGANASSPSAEWHFIGSLQSNKARDVAGAFALVHSVDRLKLAAALNSAALARGIVQPVLLQIHIGDEETKSGFELSALPIDELLKLSSLEFRGLMCLPPLTEDEHRQRANFAVLRRALADLQTSFGSQFRELSMGTSSDFEAAILEGATLVRVGTDIFGARA